MADEADLEKVEGVGKGSQQEGALEDRFSETFERVATTTERVGIPIGTFTAGTILLVLSSQTNIPILPWIGGALILAALGTYIWLTERSTTKAQLPPPPIPKEINELIEWLKEQQAVQNEWMRKIVERTTDRAE